MEMLSEKYGWTPKEIKEQDYDDISNYVDIIELKNRLTKIHQKNGRK